MSTLFSSRWLRARQARRRALQALVDRAEITEALRRYASGVDRIDAGLVRSAYHPDAHDDHGDWSGDVDAFVAAMPGFLGQFEVTMHLLGLPSIELDGDTARVETYALAFHRRTGRRDGALKDDVWGVRYLDRFERRGGEWRIADRRMTRDWRRVDPVPSPGGTG